MMFTFAVLLAFASGPAAALESTPCDTTGVTVDCTGQGLVEIPAIHHNGVVRLDLQGNNIDSLFTVAARRTRHRRDWTSPCDSVEFTSEKNGGEVNYMDTDKELVIIGDYDPANNADSSELSTVPASSLCNTVADTLEFLVLSGNKIASVPPLGTANGGLNMKKLRGFIVGGNVITELSADTFTGVATLEQIDISENLIAVLPSGLFKDLSLLAYISFNNNKIMRMAVDLFADTPFKDLDQIASMGDGNVLVCGAPDRLSDCQCDGSHADTPAGATSSVSAGNVQCSVVVDSALADTADLKDLAAQFLSQVDELETKRVTLAAAASGLAAAKAQLTAAHATLDTYGCPGITRRFRYRK